MEEPKIPEGRSLAGNWNHHESFSVSHTHSMALTLYVVHRRQLKIFCSAVAV